MLLTSDIHWGITNAKVIRKFFKRAAKEDFDVMVIAGDFSGKFMGEQPTGAVVRELRRSIPDKPVLAVLGNHDCISEDTEILTEDGWKRYDAISRNDKVATMGPGQSVEWQQPTDIFSRALREGEVMYDYDTPVSSMNVTENHRILTVSRRGDISIRNAKDCPSDFSLITAVHTTNSKVPYSDNQLRLAAWMCTDSHFAKDYGTLTLYQRKSNVHKILSLLDDLNIPYKYKERDRETSHIMGRRLKSKETGCEIRLNVEDSTRLSNMLNTFNNKHLPVWYKQMSDEQWEIFQEVLIDADGSQKVDCDWRVFYGRKEICEDVQIGAILHGWRASISEYREGQFRVNLAKKPLTRTVDFKESRGEPNTYKGLVWCISVPNGNFICRRNNRVHVTGNCWARRQSRKSIWPISTWSDFVGNYKKILNHFKENNIYFLDTKGPYRHPDFQDIVFVGHSGWYRHPYPPTNDAKFLPIYEKQIHPYLFTRALKKAQRNLDLAKIESHETLVYVSHFSVIDTGDDYKGGFEQFGGSADFGQHIKDTYDCRYFLCGHAHRSQDGPLVYESGADYYNPKYMIIDIW